MPYAVWAKTKLGIMLVGRLRDFDQAKLICDMWTTSYVAHNGDIVYMHNWK